MTTNHNAPSEAGLVRTSILVRPETDKELRRLAAEARRPLSWEIRHALEVHVENATDQAAA